MALRLLLYFLLLILINSCCYCKSTESSHDIEKVKFTLRKSEDKPNDDKDHDEMVVVNVSEFVAKVKGGLPSAKLIANRLNLKLVRQVFPDSDYFLFVQEYVNESDRLSGDDLESRYWHHVNRNESRRHRKRERAQDNRRRNLMSRSIDVDEIEKIKRESNVVWVQQQIPKVRKKRDFILEDKNVDQDSSDEKDLKFNDPMWSKLWYINNKEAQFSNSMRIKEAWKLGYTGKGVVVTILDDGLEWDHPDLVKNYDFKASLDINDSDNDPRPRYDRYNYNKHGTRCAGEIAAVADNKICSVGVAYNSRIGGIRMLDGEVTDLVEATALSYNRDYIDIYSASWGPDDDGKTVDGPGFLALKAIEDGIKYGRKGLGSIYVWASGNGGKDDDNCNCDGYTNSIYTISISSATQNGNIPWYSEACSSTIASTFSSGSFEERQIITTDLRKSCTEAHTGTSASAPLAAGIIALTLEANPDLTWRDVQHIIVETSRPENLSSSDWQLNGANRKVSHSFGYGMMDALSMVETAKTWVTVPTQRKCVIESSKNGHNQKPILIPKGDKLVIELFSTGCKGTRNEINYLEHVQAVISVQSNSRGTLVVYLRSPTGTNSTLLDRRMLDQSTESFNKWPFTTVHMWGETPQGTWTLEIKNNAKNTTYLNLNLILYGTKENPKKRDLASSGLSSENEKTNIRTRRPSQSNGGLVVLQASNKQQKPNSKVMSSANQQKTLGDDNNNNKEDGVNRNNKPSLISIFKWSMFSSSTSTTTTTRKTTTTTTTTTTTSPEISHNVNSDYYGTTNNEESEDDDTDGAGGGEDEEEEVKNVPAETIDMNQQQANSNENYVDYYNDGASVNNVGSGKDSAIVGNDIDYDSTSIASNQHSSMLRNGVQLSHERSSYATYSSSSSSVYFLIPFKSIVVITVFIVYFIYN